MTKIVPEMPGVALFIRIIIVLHYLNAAQPIISVKTSLFM